MPHFRETLHSQYSNFWPSVINQYSDDYNKDYNDNTKDPNDFATLFFITSKPYSSTGNFKKTNRDTTAS